MKINLQTFGPFRTLGENIELEMREGEKISSIRGELKKYIKKHHPSFANIKLINSSHFANESEILAEEYILAEGDIITIIPPVAGG